MHDSPADRADSKGRPRADHRARTDDRPRADKRLAHLITELQGRGLRVEVPLESRQGGAGPADAGMLWVDGFAATVPTGAHYARTSPYVLRAEDDGWAVYRDGERLASAEPSRRPRYYDLATADGIPYWKIALLHLDSVASTVNQTCAYWGNADQCAFCGIGVTLANGRTIARKTPEMLAEVAVAARDLDGAVDATLTTGTTATPDKGALYVARCGQAVREASGLPVEVQFEPPRDLDVIDRVARHGHLLGRHPRRDLRPAGPGPDRPGQGAHRDRRLLPGLGAGGRRVRRGPGVYLRDSRHGGGPRPDRGGVPPGDRHRRLPVRGAAAPDRGQPDGRPRSPPRPSTARRSTAGSCPT